MRIYLAASFSHRPEMERIADALTLAGHTVTSRWVYDRNDQNTNDVVMSRPDLARAIAERDLEDIDAAEILVTFTYEGPNSRGGRHIETGYAIGRGMPVVTVGAPHNVFHLLPHVRAYATKWSFLEAARNHAIV